MLDFLIITLVILIITKWLQSKPFFWKNAGIPYSIPLPFVGSMVPGFYTPYRYVFQQMYKKIGDSPMFGFHYFQHPALLLADPNLIKTVTMNETDKFMNRGFHSEESYDPFAKGLFFREGEQWKTYRSKMTPFFTPTRIKSMMPLVEPIGDKLTEYILRDAKSGPVDVHAASMKLSVDVVMSTVFGLKPDAFDDPNSYFFSLQKETVSFLFSFKAYVGSLWSGLYRFLGLTTLSGSATSTLKKFVNDVIDQRLIGIGKRLDFVQGMIELMEKEKANGKGQTDLYEDGSTVARFDRYSISGHCMFMYVAGTETTGNSLSFLLYELALHPEIQETARQEILAMIKRTNNEYNFEDLFELRYVQMIIKETLRKHPTVVVYSRQCTKAFTLNDIEIPVGTMIFISPIALHYDKRFFPEPEKFIPERFEDDSVVTGSYSPFGLGPRICIGMRLAQTEMIIALCKLLPKCRISASSRTEVPLRYNYNPTLSPANGIWLNIEEIN